MRTTVLFLLLTLGLASGRDGEGYRGHQVLSVRAQTPNQVELLKELMDKHDEIIFLTLPSSVKQTEFVVPPNLIQEVTSALREADITIELLFADAQKEIERSLAENERNRLYARSVYNSPHHDSPSHTVYYTYSEVVAIINNFAQAYKDLAQVHSLPYKTFEDKTVYYLTVTGKTNSAGTKPVIIVETLLHAREWITTAAAIYTIDNLLKNYEAGDAKAVQALDNFTWIFLVVANPDGYEYTFTANNRLWRKNRKRVTTNCYGVDLNRNFDVQFGGVGSSSACSSETYHGQHAFSEQETLNIRHLVETHYNNLISYLSVHSYSQLLLKPWGYTTSASVVPPNINELNRVGTIVNAELSSHGATHTFGTAAGVLGYAAAGCAEDWALTHKPGIYAYCYELRPRTSAAGGFIVAASQIPYVGAEVYHSFLALAAAILPK
ncbi:LOW QUALITY PROTEIN: carboxypeptidase B-like [Pomacea canaliculata]|uniref:LOW QUALITY PROTEIN: carboxypeptidase B-like n=1 Tax=Pomacea canaliculata TaxID=400727 RepID=UPI000D735849|nr:LOW QUALITY PROTEIN: carboxypeptidase B-like [Pomacea canaliculata]